MREAIDTVGASQLGCTVLDLGLIEEREIYAALDWLGEQQDRMERSLARRHLKNGALVLYDISSSYVEGCCCELARHGYSRDRRPDRLQMSRACSAAVMAGRSRSRCSRAMSAIRVRFPPRSAS